MCLSAQFQIDPHNCFCDDSVKPRPPFQNATAVVPNLKRRRRRGCATTRAVETVPLRAEASEASASTEARSSGTSKRVEDNMLDCASSCRNSPGVKHSSITLNVLTCACLFCGRHRRWYTESNRRQVRSASVVGTSERNFTVTYCVCDCRRNVTLFRWAGSILLLVCDMHVCFRDHPLGANNSLRSGAVGAISVLRLHTFDGTAVAICSESVADACVVVYLHHAFCR